MQVKKLKAKLQRCESESAKLQRRRNDSSTAPPLSQLHTFTFASSRFDFATSHLRLKGEVAPSEHHNMLNFSLIFGRILLRTYPHRKFAVLFKSRSKSWTNRSNRMSRPKDHEANLDLVKKNVHCLHWKH